MRASLLFLIAGCLGTPCPRLAVPSLAACVVPEGGWVDQPAGDYAVSLSLTLLDVVDAAPSDDCLQAPVGDVASEGRVWLRGQDADQATWIVGLAAPELTAARFAAVGDAMTVDAALQFGGFSPTVGHVEVRDAAGLVAWVGEAGGLDGLTTPAELELAEGGPVCRVSDTCGAYRLLDLVATWDGQEVDLPRGATVRVGDHDLVHSTYEQQVPSTTPRCADWFVARVLAGVFRAE